MKKQRSKGHNGQDKGALGWREDSMKGVFGACRDRRRRIQEPLWQIAPH